MKIRSDVSNLIKPQKKVVLNLMQMTAILANHQYGIKNVNVEAGRAAGKSTILGWFVKEAVRQMPRSTGVIVGETFVQIKTRTLPSTKEGMEMFGLYEGIDYLVGRCGQKEGFEMPFQSPDSWANVIHFRNGAIAVMVSLDNPNSGRGLNSYWVMGDEAALLTYERLYNNVLTTNRSVKPHFRKKTMLNATVFTSSVAMTEKGAWFTAREEKAKRNPDKYCFLKFNSLVNKHNLTEGWIEQMREEALSKVLFDAEIMNIRPRGVSDGFYAQLDKRHYYSYQDDIDEMGEMVDDFVPTCRYNTDLVRGVPLQFNLDFGGRINCGTVSQYLSSINEIRFIKEFFVKNPKILSDLVQEFIEYYEYHKHSCNIVHLYHDRSGYKTEANSKTTLAEDVENLLRKAGWKVINKTPNTNNPDHIEKHRLINQILSEQNNQLPKVRINENRCHNLIISMENTPLKENDAFKKDKSSERSSTIPQEHATHFSDTVDYCLFWQFNYLIDSSHSNSFPITNLY